MGGWYLWILPLLFLVLFYFYPLGSILEVSYSRSEAGLLGSLLELFRSSSLRRVIAFTFGQASLSTLLTLLLGLPGAYAFARFSFPGRAVMRAVSGIPFVLPTLVVAAAFNALLGPSGWLNLGLMRLFNMNAPPLQLLNSLAAILIAHVFYNTTIVLRLVGDFWSHLNPKLGGAARMLGASPWRTLRTIIFPLLAPAILAASLLVFIFNFTSFGVVLVLGGPRFATMEVEIFNQTVGLFNLPTAASLALIQLLFTLALTLAYSRLSERVSRPLQLRGAAEIRRRPSTPAQRLSLWLPLGGILILLILPLLALALRSLVGMAAVRPGESGFSGFTLAYYRALTGPDQTAMFLVRPIEAVYASLRYAAATVILSLVIGLPAAWSLAYRGQDLSSRILDPVLMLPLGTSAVTLGLGFIIALDSPPLNLRASPWLIPIAHSLVAFPFVVRSLIPALRSIQPRLRQAAAALGAAPASVLRYVDLPLVSRALLVAAAFAFTISLGEFGATSLIARPENPTLPVMIYRFLSRPGSLSYGQAMALSTILMLVTGVGIVAIERFRIADVGEF
jgi:thiamine transport system permease protein